MKKPFRKPAIGDRVELIINQKGQQGILLESYDSMVILLKLENGYNIAFKKSDISEIKLIEKKAEKNHNKETPLKLSGKKPIIDFILTGGTISSKLDSASGGVKWLINSQELFHIYPDIFPIADVRVHNPFMKASENMSSRDWQRLAKLTARSLRNPEVKGVIIAHGTDTLHYTGAALSFMLGKLNKPVVLTYAQRSSDRGSSDARLNLTCAAHVALSDIAEVMLVGHANLDDDYCYAFQGNKCRKMHTSRRDTFKAINTKPIAKIFPDGRIELLRKQFNIRNKNNVTIDAVFNEKVALLTFYPGQSPDILTYYYKKKYKGIVIAMTGLGHVLTEGKHNWLSPIKEAIKRGMIICAAPQTIYGRLDPYVYAPGRKLADAGVIYLGDMLAETALIKLGWVLGHKHWRGSVATKIKMLENINGEFNERLECEFL